VTSSEGNAKEDAAVAAISSDTWKVQGLGENSSTFIAGATGHDAAGDFEEPVPQIRRFLLKGEENRIAQGETVANAGVNEKKRKKAQETTNLAIAALGGGGAEGQDVSTSKRETAEAAEGMDCSKKN